MRTIVAELGTEREADGEYLCAETVVIQDVPVHIAMIRVPEGLHPVRRSDSDVLLRVHAFSLNYRDRAVVLSGFTINGLRPSRGIGSEFVASVVEAGAAVTDLAVGDRVVAQMGWPGPPTGEIVGGVPTNEASREYLCLDRRQLMRIPDDMPLETAAAFSLGAQTAFGMVRRLNLEPGAKVLLTAATSNTSLAALRVLRTRGARVFALTQTLSSAPKLIDLGAERVLGFNPEDGHRVIAALANEIGGLDAVIDPFTDVYLPHIVGGLRYFGTYVTCGLAGQARHGTSPDPHSLMPWAALAPRLIERNVTIVGNCLGTYQDLQCAMEEWSVGRYDVAIDSVFTGQDIGAFVHRTFNAPERFGKVVYKYE